MLLRGFFDLVASRVKERFPEQAALLGCFSQAWPDEIEISMERNIQAETFPGIGVARAILVELTPAGVVTDLPPEPTEIGGTGRVDATVVVRQSDGDGLALVIESKLYGRAGHEQLMKYKQALESRSIKTVLVDVAWEEIYTLADSLPEAAEHDAILSDFKAFLARDPRLAGFTGFRQGDFDGPAYVLDARLQKLCETLAGQSTGSALQGAKVERKRGGLDYDILLADQSRLVGNIGLACWEQESLYAKLVIGWRSRWETNRAIESSSAAERVRLLLQKLCSRADITIDATVRPFFNRFQYSGAARWCRVVKRNEDPSDVWPSLIEFARSYHAKPLNRERLARLQRPPVSVIDQDSLNKALEQQVNCFVPLGLTTAWQPEDLAGLKPDELTKVVRETLTELADLLMVLSGVPNLP